MIVNVVSSTVGLVSRASGDWSFSDQPNPKEKTMKCANPNCSEYTNDTEFCVWCEEEQQEKAWKEDQAEMAADQADRQ